MKNFMFFYKKKSKQNKSRKIREQGMSNKKIKDLIKKLTKNQEMSMHKKIFKI